MSAWDIYWLTRLEPLLDASVAFRWGLFVISAIFVIIAAIAWTCSLEEREHQAKDTRASALRMIKCAAVSVCLTIIPWTVSVLTPSKSDLAIIFAGAWATNSEEMQKLPDNVVGTLNKFMTDYIKKDEPQK